MNPLLIPTLIGTFSLFFLGIWLARNVRSRFQDFILATVGFVAGIPAVLFVVYYTGILGEAEWFYSFRAMPGTELAAGGVGLLAGWLQAKRTQYPRISKQMSPVFIPFIMVLCIAIPYLKPIFLRPDWNSFDDRWSENVCLQSSESSCGPASAATLLNFFGKPASEKQIAQASFTSRRGTENWYLIRTLRRQGLDARYSIHEADRVNLPFPAIIGVRLGGKDGTGHFIAVLDKNIEPNKTRYVIGDPLNGREEISTTELFDRYYFTGFAILVTTNQF